MPAAIVLAAFMATVTRRPRLAGIGAVVVCVQTAMMYWPLAEFRVMRLDRVRRYVEERLPENQELFAAIVLTLALSLAYAATVRLRYTREATRRNALVIPVVLTALLLHLVLVLALPPQTREWSPPDWHRQDLLVPFRPCRGAILWQVDGARELPLVRIDDVWLQFDDPRGTGPPVRAVSGRGEWQEGYFWLRDDEAAQLHMRADDPSVIRCDSAGRPELVVPAEWHDVGLRHRAP